VISAIKTFAGSVLLLSLLACQVAPEPQPAPAPEPEPAPKPVTEVKPPEPESVTKEPPTDYNRRDYLAVLKQLKLGEEGALPKLEKLSQQAPALEYIFTNLGIAYFNQEKYPEAQAAFERAISQNKDDAIAYNHLGILTRIRGEFEKSRQHYDRAINIDNEYAAAHLNLGILFDIYIQDIEQALAHYRKYQSLTNNENKAVAGWIVDIERRIQ
jgi:tetratricopeptide (TPR) repeat protein